MFCENNIYFLVILTLMVGNVENGTYFKLRSISCKDIDKKIAEFQICQMKAINRDVTEINLRIRVYQKQINNATVEMFIKRRGFDRGGPIFPVSVDGCAFFRNKRRNPVAEMFYNLMGLAKYSNLNHSCPYDHDIIINHYRFNESNAQFFVPFSQGEYTLYTKWYTYNALCTIYNVNFQVYDKWK